MSRCQENPITVIDLLIKTLSLHSSTTYKKKKKKGQADRINKRQVLLTVNTSSDHIKLWSIRRLYIKDGNPYCYITHWLL